MKIRLSKTDSINSVNKKNNLEVEIKNTSKLLPYYDIVGKVNAYNVFEDEKGLCTKYRIIISINPYCTNVLFNPLTEIVKDEGSNSTIVVTDNVTYNVTDNNPSPEIEKAYGKSTPTRQDMIMNTEYSRDDIGYSYFPGFDFFNNHLLRNKSFKVINLYEDDKSDSYKDIFNTIEDYMRYMDGSIVQIGKRKKIGETPEVIPRHLYLYDEIMSLEESINSNLSEDNGWIGFTNTNNVFSKRNNEKILINKALNNKENCEFIDMYPSRNLFLFSPNVNKFRKRIEKNWDTFITYPYRNEYCHDVITSKDGKINGLKILSIFFTENSYGGNVIVFRSYIKHGMQRGDSFNLYFDGDNVATVNVTNIGDMSEDINKNEYYFYTNNTSFLNDIGYTYDYDVQKWKKDGIIIESINEELNKHEIRIKHLVNNIESEYYIRVFRKLPNLKYKKEELTDNITSDHSKYENYIYGNKMNASYNDGNNSYMYEFDNESYNLSFAKTIYNDNCAQVTFTDTVDIEHLVDNNGCPLKEIYLTIVKNNKGYEKWYGVKYNEETNKYDYDGNLIDYRSEDIEYSHCFGNISSGVEILYDESDKYNSSIMEKKSSCGDVHLLNTLNIFNPRPLEKSITKYGSNIEKDEFYGDFTEYRIGDCTEKTLQKICHRFNTVQREMPKNKEYHIFQDDEIKHDDLDYEDFSVVKTNIAQNSNINYDGNDQHNFTLLQRPEGYYYYPHYRIALKEQAGLNQSTHYDVKVKSTELYPMNELFMKVTTKISYSVSAGDIIYLCIDDLLDYKKDLWYELYVSYKDDNNSLYLHPNGKQWKDLMKQISKDTGIDNSENILNILNIAKMLENGYITNEKLENTYEVRLRIKNTIIPNYASKINHNKFLWRELYFPGSLYNGTMNEYPYANNSFYISENINFYLKRQDPFGKVGLRFDSEMPNDVSGILKSENNYIYKDEEEIIC